MSLSHTDLESFFKINFALMQYQKWNLEFIENLMPFEKEIYIMLLLEHLEEEEAKAKRANPNY